MLKVLLKFNVTFISVPLRFPVATQVREKSAHLTKEQRMKAIIIVVVRRNEF